MPSPPELAITLPASDRPPIVGASPVTSIPSPPLPRPGPPASVPIWLPWIVTSFAVTRMPSSPFSVTWLPLPYTGTRHDGALTTIPSPPFPLTALPMTGPQADITMPSPRLPPITLVNTATCSLPSATPEPFPAEAKLVSPIRFPLTFPLAPVRTRTPAPPLRMIVLSREACDCPPIVALVPASWTPSPSLSSSTVRSTSALAESAAITIPSSLPSCTPRSTSSALSACTSMPSEKPSRLRSSIRVDSAWVTPPALPCTTIPALPAPWSVGEPVPPSSSTGAEIVRALDTVTVVTPLAKTI